MVPKRKRRSFATGARLMNTIAVRVVATTPPCRRRALCTGDDAGQSFFLRQRAANLRQSRHSIDASTPPIAYRSARKASAGSHPFSVMVNVLMVAQISWAKFSTVAAPCS